ncbi:MAG: peptidylprolyl isomerase [Verrucomicrobiales bacterium]|nr:peptidylprolyl isomerase [Verrucomicrobiales bacterium]
MSNTPKEVAIIQTRLGEMVLTLWPDVAPNTVENFKSLARRGFFNGTCFHRIMKGFMIQGGDPLTKEPDREELWGTGDPGYQLKAEFNDRAHVRGVISMARGEDPDSAGSQFFICLADARFLDGNYTAFGQLVQGDEALDAIGNTPVAAGPDGELSKPAERIEIDSVRIAPASAFL